MLPQFLGHTVHLSRRENDDRTSTRHTPNFFGLYVRQLTETRTGFNIDIWDQLNQKIPNGFRAKEHRFQASPTMEQTIRENVTALWVTA